jgi:sodium-dependent phosphate cotransporter
MIGVLFTVLMDSSSATTSLVITLVGAGLISIKQGIYLIMGANIGTTLTNTLVALSHLGDSDDLERAFAGATIHDTFNYLSVVIFLPIEVATGMLYYMSRAMVQNYGAKDTEEFNGPIARWVDPLGMLVLMNNKKVTEGVAKGGKCEDFYPIGKTLD